MNLCNLSIHQEAFLMFVIFVGIIVAGLVIYGIHKYFEKPHIPSPLLSRLLKELENSEDWTISYYDGYEALWKCTSPKYSYVILYDDLCFDCHYLAFLEEGPDLLDQKEKRILGDRIREIQQIQKQKEEAAELERQKEWAKQTFTNV